MQIEVRVKLKEQVLDPQGEAIRRVLGGLGYQEVGIGPGYTIGTRGEAYDTVILYRQLGGR